MKRYNSTYNYGGPIYQTEQMKFLLCFHAGSEFWLGVYPGCSFDHYYDDVMFQLGPDEIDQAILEQRRTIPTMIYPFRELGKCQKPLCENETAYKYCSITCWYTNSLDTHQYTIDTGTDSEREVAVDFKRKLINQFSCVEA